MPRRARKAAPCPVIAHARSPPPGAAGGPISGRCGSPRRPCHMAPPRGQILPRVGQSPPAARQRWRGALAGAGEGAVRPQSRGLDSNRRAHGHAGGRAAPGPGARCPNSRLAWTPMAVRRGGCGRTPSRTSRAQVHVMAVRKGRVSSPPMAAASAPVMIARIPMRRPAHTGPQNPAAVLAPASGSFSARAAVSRAPGPGGIPTGHACGRPTATVRIWPPARIQGSLPGAGPIAPPKSRVQGACGQAGPVPST